MTSAGPLGTPAPSTTDDALVSACPACATRFRVLPAQLERAGGRVRCGACLTIFDGVAGLTADSARAWANADGGAGRAAGGTESPAAEAPAAEAPAGEARAAADGPTAEAAAPSAAPLAFHVVDAATADAATETGADGDPPGGELPGDEATGDGNAREAPVVFGERSRRRPWLWLGIVVALLLLPLQVLWYQYDAWSRDPAWRPVYEPLCRLAGCRLPVLRDRSQLAISSRNVFPHPQQPGRLLVRAVIVNEAEFDQPFPLLELRFTSGRGQLVAGRRLRPREYLAGDAEGMTLIPRRTPVQIEVALNDPGEHAVNWSLRLL